jgi:hypothetical protein
VAADDTAEVVGSWVVGKLGCEAQFEGLRGILRREMRRGSNCGVRSGDSSRGVMASPATFSKKDNENRFSIPRQTFKQSYNQAIRHYL